MSRPPFRRKHDEDTDTSQEDNEAHDRARHNLAQAGKNERSSRRKRKMGSRAKSNHAPRDPQAARGRSSSNHAAAAARPEDQRGAPQEMATSAALLERFRQILSGQGPRETEFDVQKARVALEATAGDTKMAAQLFWDDYFASQAGFEGMDNFQPPAQGGQQKMAARSNHDESSDYYDEDDDDDDEDEAVEDYHPHRKLRRSLDKDFGRAAGDKAPANGPQEETENRSIDPEVQLGHRQLGNDAPDQEDQAAEGSGETVSISDDEANGAGVWRIVGNMVAHMDDGTEKEGSRRQRRRNQPREVDKKIKEAAAAVAKKVLPPETEDEIPERRKGRQDMVVDDDLDYISDNDWLEEHPCTLRAPLEILWGRGDNIPSSGSSGAEDNQGNPANAGQAGSNEADGNEPHANGSNNGDAEEGNVIPDEEAKDKAAGEGGIPHTWLNAGFKLSSCGTGLDVQPPKVEDVAGFVWRQPENPGTASSIPPPFHCKAISAVLCIVTATMYTGASIQGQVNCASARKPFHTLAVDVRRREFESRLADALSALIRVAANASMERRTRALEKATTPKASTDPSQATQDSKIRAMRRRLTQIPVCSWEDGKTSPAGPRAAGDSLYKSLQVSTSLIHIDDIGLYVLSNLRAFMARGGVALFLETILRIHGKGAVSNMVQRARKHGNTMQKEGSGLIKCNCQERQSKMYQDNPLAPSVRNDPSKLLDTTPPGTECVSIEFLSLLTAGRVHTTWQGWSTEGLDFGFLTRGSGKMGWQLARPEQPVWILKGDTCFSVLWLAGAVDLERRSVSKFDNPGAVLELGHWNCWYGERNKSEMRLIPAVGKWSPPKFVKGFSDDAWKASRDPRKPRHTRDLLLERRSSKLANLVSADEHESGENHENSLTAEEEADRLKSNPDDQGFYPNNYRMWRFAMDGEAAGAETSASDHGGGSAQNDHWIPYHRLSSRQKMLVEMKMGPKIKPILWTRWPGATVDKFSPKDEEDSMPIV